MRGFGTEKIEDELAALFPNAVVQRMDMDTTRSKNGHQRIISDFEHHKTDILVGTQMVTKGLDFDRVSVVGVLSADNLISFPDFRAFERAFQIMSQVSGRAGRKEVPGTVVIQSYQPDHPALKYVVSNDFASMYAAITIAALFNEKARLLHRGRKSTFPILKEKCAGKSVIWLHAASLGEYEQGKPLIQKLKQRYPNATFLVTFFSPSGYEVKKNDADIDIACYLPGDTPKRVWQFLDIVQPQMAFFVKYEYWYNFMKGLKDRKIPFYYLSAIFRPTQYFFKP